MITDYIDLAVVAIYLFWFFFAGLVFYLQKEGRREGYPLETETPGEYLDHGLFWIPERKAYNMPHGGVKYAPPLEMDTRPVAGTPVDGLAGSPIEPHPGNMMLSGVGPAAWAERDDVPDRTAHGEPKILPMRRLPGFEVVGRDTDPRGMELYGDDGEKGGTVTEAWVDQGESLIRYLEVDTGERTVLIPFTLVDVKADRVETTAVLGHQVAEAPITANADEVTMLEEEKISAYFGSGYLYARSDAREPLI